VSNRVVASFAVSFTVLGATAITLAAYGAYAMRPPAISADLAIAAFAEPQTSNRAAKSSRLAGLLPTRLASADANAAYLFASAEPTAEPERAADPVTTAKPVKSVAPEVAPTSSAPEAAGAAPAPQRAAEPKLAALTPSPLPQDKPKHLLPPPPPVPHAASGVLDDSQITGLRGRLRLTSDQVEFWPAVEAALRDVVRTQLRGTGSKIARGGKMNIDVNSPEVQKLIWAAMPLLMRLREDQKSEVRKLARVIGLEQVASQI
jgi:hypothetical protein